MVKSKVPLRREPDWARVEGALAEGLPGGILDRRDGLRMARGQDWVHLRKSGTEPIVRVIAEAADPERAESLAALARGALE
jgi:phosphomannomutase